jgi:hypothetical protein
LEHTLHGKTDGKEMNVAVKKGVVEEMGQNTGTRQAEPW